LVGPVKLVRAGTVDKDALTVTLPLYHGLMRDGRPVWYILTDTTDKANADALGLNFSGKLAYAAVGRAVRHAWLQKDTSLLFDKGTVDFGPARSCPATHPMPSPRRWPSRARSATRTTAPSCRS